MQGLFSFLIILTIAAVSTWLKNQGAKSRPDDSPPGEPRPPQPSRASSWEEELRRLLADEGTPPPVPRPRPPPVVVPPAPPRSTPPPVVIKPVLVPRRPVPESVPSEIEVSAGRMAPMRESQQAYQRAKDVEQRISTGDLAPLSESRQAYLRASQLDKKVAEHIGNVPGQRVLATAVTHREASPEIAQVVGLFRSARSARQAVIASVILGPPRSLDETPAVS